MMDGNSEIFDNMAEAAAPPPAHPLAAAVRKIYIAQAVSFDRPVSAVRRKIHCAGRVI